MVNCAWITVNCSGNIIHNIIICVKSRKVSIGICSVVVAVDCGQGSDSVPGQWLAEVRWKGVCTFSQYPRSEGRKHQRPPEDQLESDDKTKTCIWKVFVVNLNPDAPSKKRRTTATVQTTHVALASFPLGQGKATTPSSPTLVTQPSTHKQHRSFPTPVTQLSSILIPSSPLLPHNSALHSDHPTTFLALNSLPHSTTSITPWHPYCLPTLRWCQW